MKPRRHNVSDDGLAISRCISRSSTSTNGRENSEPIPLDLIFEFLLRLPAKSVARCRCVSKLWASTLRGPDFTELFLTRSSSRSQLLFACRKNDDLLFFTAPPRPQNADESSSLVTLTYHMKFPFAEGSQICGHVRGLVYLTHLRTVKGRKETVPEICNPSTGQSFLLPKVRTRRVNVRSFFMYDGKQFKALSMTWPCYGRSGWLCTQHQVLTLGTGKKLSWRMIECSIIPHHPTFDGICIDGCLYYQAMVDNESGVSRIVCFDITSEEFTCIKKAEGEVTLGESTLVNHKGKLATLTSHGDCELTGQSTCIELGVLADAEKHEWSKHIHVLPPLWKQVVLYWIGWYE